MNQNCKLADYSAIVAIILIAALCGTMVVTLVAAAVSAPETRREVKALDALESTEQAAITADVAEGAQH